MFRPRPKPTKCGALRLGSLWRCGRLRSGSQESFCTESGSAHTSVGKRRRKEPDSASPPNSAPTHSYPLSVTLRASARSASTLPHFAPAQRDGLNGFDCRFLLSVFACGSRIGQICPPQNCFRVLCFYRGKVRAGLLGVKGACGALRVPPLFGLRPAKRQSPLTSVVVPALLFAR